jgi:predicted RNase H-like nuclease
MPPAKASWTGIGVDGCPAGWLAIRLRDGDWEARVFASVVEIDQAWAGRESLALIDIPIGLPADTSFRACDAAARKLLGPRSSSVFNPPTRAALAAESYAEAADLNEVACGKRLSKQTWHIMPKIAEVDRFIRSAPGLQDRFREAHPETLFQALNDDEPLLHRKRDSEGLRERLSVLEPYLPHAGEVFEGIRDRVSRRDAAPDDVVDALAAAVTAFRFADRLRTLPDRPERDAAGLRCEMVLPRIPA